MIKRQLKPFGFLLLVICFISFAFTEGQLEDWGFYGHRKINRLAVFTLPAEMGGFYKEHIEYVTDHAVDPDKRRYATKHEAVRHYMDLDHWGTYPFENVPRTWNNALLQYIEIHFVTEKGDTLTLIDEKTKTQTKDSVILASRAIKSLTGETKVGLKKRQYQQFIYNNILPIYYKDDWTIAEDSLQKILPFKRKIKTVFATDPFSSQGILPYHLASMQRRLTKAFQEEDLVKILRLSADFGHYIGDAHVPLHTTSNYNGQLTNQVGIHAFWESRLPELFAEQQYDFFVGPATYIDDPVTFYWDIVLKSHTLVDSVLNLERDLKASFPEDKQFCYEQRKDKTIRTECEDYAKAYHLRLNGMVEERMRSSIITIGSAWYTAWVDSGQPDLSGFKNKDGPKIEEKISIENPLENPGRKHE